MKRVRRKRLKRLDPKKIASIQRTKWILGIPFSSRTQIGLRVEKEIAEALEYHQRKKTKFPGRSGGREIVKVTPALHFSEEDQEEKDIILEFSDGEVGFVQAKSWWTWKEEKRLREKGICLISVRLFTRERKLKGPEEIKKEAREGSFRALFKWLSILEKKVG